MTKIKMSSLLLATMSVVSTATYANAQDTAFTRRGASQAAQKQDSARCWRLAQKARLTEEQATQNVVTAYLIGGIFGVLIASATNDEANKDPKSAFRRQVHDECMAKRGYRRIE